MKLDKMTKQKIDEFFDSKTHEELEYLWKKYDKYSEENLTIPVVIRQSEQLKEKKTRDIINWVKSDLAQEQNNKLTKTQTPYRIEKIRFLRKLESLMSDL